MILKSLFVATAVISIVFGLADILIPAQVISWWELNPSDDLVGVIRLLGVLFVTVAVLAWRVRNAPDSEALRAIVLSLFVGDALAVVVSIFVIVQLGGTNALGWFSTAVYLVLAIGFGSQLFARPGPAQTTP